MEGVRWMKQYGRGDNFCGYYRLLHETFRIESNIERFREEFENLYPCNNSGKIGDITESYFVWEEEGDDTSELIYSVYQNNRILYKTVDPLRLLPFLEWHLNNTTLAKLDNYLQVHAGVIAKNGKGIILPASTEGGKTTLIIGLMMRGFKYLSDEVALIDPRTHNIFSFPKNLCLKEGAFNLFDPLRIGIQSKEYYVRSSKGRVCFINPERITPNAIGCPCEVAFLIFPHYNPSNPLELKKISKSEAVLNMAKRLLNLPYFQGEWLDILVELAKKAECYNISVNNLPDTVELISHLVEER